MTIPASTLNQASPEDILELSDAALQAQKTMGLFGERPQADSPAQPQTPADASAGEQLAHAAVLAQYLQGQDEFFAAAADNPVAPLSLYPVYPAPSLLPTGKGTG